MPVVGVLIASSSNSRAFLVEVGVADGTKLSQNRR